MYTSMMLLALSGWFAPVAHDLESPHWQNDYTAASQQGVKEKKPLAVFIGSGLSGWEKVGRAGKLGKTAQETLAAQYVCLYVDASTEDGKRLARAFDIPNGLGVIISDRSGETQAFHHQGDLSGDDLNFRLKKYADPSHIVRSTESNSSERISNYPPVPGSGFQPFTGGFGGGGRSC